MKLFIFILSILAFQIVQFSFSLAENVGAGVEKDGDPVLLLSDHRDGPKVELASHQRVRRQVLHPKKQHQLANVLKGIAAAGAGAGFRGKNIVF